MIQKKDIRYTHMIIACALILLAFIITNNLSKARRNTNETYAIESLKAISAAMENWRLYNQTYATATLENLAKQDPSYVDDKLAKGIKGGYSFMLMPLSADEYMCIATPLSEKRTGTKIFRITEKGTIEFAGDNNWQRFLEES